MTPLKQCLNEQWTDSFLLEEEDTGAFHVDDWKEPNEDIHILPSR